MKRFSLGDHLFNRKEKALSAIAVKNRYVFSSFSEKSGS